MPAREVTDLASRIILNIEMVREYGVDPHEGYALHDPARDWACERPEGPWTDVDISTSCRECLFALSIAVRIHRHEREVVYVDKTTDRRLTEAQIEEAIDLALAETRT